MSAPSKILVVYKKIDGAHFFVSNTLGTEGFCVASMDPITAFNEVAIQLNELAKSKGEVCNYVPKLSLDDFLAFIKQTDGPLAIKPIAAEAFWGHTHLAA